MNRHVDLLQAKANLMSAMGCVSPAKLSLHWADVQVWGDNNTYRVRVFHSGRVECQCKFVEYNPERVCSHKIAALTPVGYTAKVHTDEASARRAKRMIRQVNDVWVTFRKDN
jgi:hypothetical protein